MTSRTLGGSPSDRTTSDEEILFFPPRDSLPRIFYFVTVTHKIYPNPSRHIKTNR